MDKSIMRRIAYDLAIFFGDIFNQITPCVASKENIFHMAKFECLFWDLFDFCCFWNLKLKQKQNVQHVSRKLSTQITALWENYEEQLTT